MGGFFKVLPHLPGNYTGEGRPPRRPRQFKKQMTIRDVPRADNPVGYPRTGSGRHGGRPSQEQEVNSNDPNIYHCLSVSG